MGVGQAAPSIQAVAKGRGAAYNVWKVLDRTSEIDSLDENGVAPNKIVGNISFKDVNFS